MRDSLRLVVVLTLVATLSGGILAYTWDKIMPIIEANNAAALAESILEVMPGAVSYEIWTVEASSSVDVDAAASSTVATDSAAGSTLDADATATGTVADADATATSTVVDADATASGTADADATATGTTATADADATASGTVDADTTATATAATDSAASSTPDADATASGTADADATASGTVDGTSGSSLVANNLTIYRGLDANGNTAGIAMAFEANGYGGPIRMMVGVDPATRRLTQVKVLGHSETPGLGARITEPAFLRQFENKSIDDAFVAKQDVDAIAGATVSSLAVAGTIKAALTEVETELRAGGAW
ncbi:MAG: FMN-binding protein [Firmicutes bacterium]|jgi:RnfABCDGE-type electron transport complex G subunit|nr:FMN-binding protein [Bacillota bacterium]